jgi:predicted SnoaL-like aldol condensation-catalyzing enzyme
MQTRKKELVVRFIEEIWNRQDFEQADALVHPQFKDHSLPKALPTGKEGLKQWITALGASFEHKTIIEDQVSEGDKIAVRISLLLKHTGTWRAIPPTGTKVTAKGFRFFRVKEGKIIEHWGLIDGQTIENQLKKATQGCAVAVQKKVQV